MMAHRKRMGGDACVAEGEGLNVNWTRATIKVWSEPILPDTEESQLLGNGV
jgi:hypothetical protein